MSACHSYPSIAIQLKVRSVTPAMNNTRGASMSQSMYEHIRIETLRQRNLNLSQSAQTPIQHLRRRRQTSTTTARTTTIEPHQKVQYCEFQF